jgi:DNA adenine methylase
MPHKFHRLVEPFSGMAAISVAVAGEKRADSFIINDLNAPLVNMLRAAIETPTVLIDKYSILWNEQFRYGDHHTQHFYEVRDRFNSGDDSPENMLYLLARCVKGAVRYAKDGKFNQSPDKRRHGTSPMNISANITAVSALLNGKCSFASVDYKEILALTKPGDLVYMDPPYQGVTNVRDNRYYSGVPFHEFAAAIEILNRKGVDYLISYDGECGGKSYGEELPSPLGCEKILLNAGLSSQATLLGKKETTFEALYVSRNLQPYIYRIPYQLTLREVAM